MLHPLKKCPEKRGHEIDFAPLKFKCMEYWQTIFSETAVDRTDVESISGSMPTLNSDAIVRK